MKNLQASPQKNQKQNALADMSAWARKLALHLKEFDREFYQELKKDGQLKEYCERQADLASDTWLKLAEKGVSQFEARQIALAQYIYPSKADMP